jgi:hypothetical protein
MVAKDFEYRCPECNEPRPVTPNNRYRKHGDCRMNGKPVPVPIIREGPITPDGRPVRGKDFDVCPGCERKPKLDERGAFKEHVTETGGTERCMFSGKLPNGKKPPSLEDGFEMNGGTQESFSGESLCPVCAAKVPNYNGTLEHHMNGAGTKECPMSGKTPEEFERWKSAASGTNQTTESSNNPGLIGAESTDAVTVHTPEPIQREPKRITSLGDPAPEIKALAAAFPKRAPIQGSTVKESAPPAHADVPDTPFIAALKEETKSVGHALSSTAPVASPETAAIQSAPQTDIVSRSVNPGDTPAIHVDSRGPNSDEKCRYCNTPLGGTHTCNPRFVAAGDVCEPFSCTDGGHIRDPECEFHEPSLFTPAGEVPKALEPAPMSALAEQLAGRFREMFYAYSNRMERSVQETLGPSEIGTPCDRRLAMSLLHIPPVNPGMDGWASFVGTCIHSGLADMFQWADANQGRFVVEVPLEFPSKLVPKGTSDLLDRVLCMVDDHKAMGRFSLDKLRTEGIKPLYRTQLHVYAYGQKLKGERITHVACIGWPREQATLKDLYAVVEPYDESIALDAFARIEEINKRVAVARARERGTKLQIARLFPVQDDCAFCPFYSKGDSMMERGCNGRP